MDWPTLYGGGVLLLLAIAVLHVLWRLLLILVLLGPPTLIGLSTGQLAASQFSNVPFGILTAVIVTGVLSEVTALAVRRLRDCC